MFREQRKIYEDLHWLASNNSFYREATVDQNVRIDTEDLLRVQRPEHIEVENIRELHIVAYMPTNPYLQL